MCLIHDPPCQILSMSLFCYSRWFASSVSSAVRRGPVLAAGNTVSHSGAFCLLQLEIISLVCLGIDKKSSPLRKDSS